MPPTRGRPSIQIKNPIAQMGSQIRQFQFGHLTFQHSDSPHLHDRN